MQAAQRDKAKGKKWVKPALSKLRAGHAENSRAGPNFDLFVGS